MELVFVKEMKKEKDGNTFSRRDYTISNYKVIVENACYGGDLCRSINVRATGSYLPPIYFEEDYLGLEKPSFKIGTVSYGSLNQDEFKAFLTAQQTALEVAEVLTREFCYSRNTLAVLKGILTGCLSYAVQPLGYLKHSPALYLKLPSSNVKN